MKISEKQLAQVNDRIKALVSAGSFYGKKLEEAGVTSVANAEEFEKLPFSEKADLRDAYPLGLMTAPEEEIVRIHSSSGTTGLPVIIPYTAKDVDDWGEMFKRCYETAGITNQDRIHITPGYGLWTAGIGFQNGAEKLGAMVIPMGPGNTEKQLQMMMDMKSTVPAPLHPTPFFWQKKSRSAESRTRSISRKVSSVPSAGARQCVTEFRVSSVLSSTISMD